MYARAKYFVCFHLTHARANAISAFSYLVLCSFVQAHRCGRRESERESEWARARDWYLDADGFPFIVARMQKLKSPIHDLFYVVQMFAFHLWMSFFALLSVCVFISFYFWFVDLLFHFAAAAAVVVVASSTCVFISIFSYLMCASARAPIFLICFFPFYFARCGFVWKTSFVARAVAALLCISFEVAMCIDHTRFNFSNIWSASPARNSCSP